jgi:hypothetical protein
MTKMDFIDEANRKVIDIMLKGNPVLADIKPAIEVIPRMSKDIILHAGPPIRWEDMCQAQKNAILGGIIYEGLADSHSKAMKVVERGEIKLSPCHEHATVGGMTGVTTASMPVYVVKNLTYENTAYSNHHEGWPIKALQWGNNDDEVIAHLRWLERVLTPVLRVAIKEMGGLNVKKIIAKALQMNDECHSRCTAATALFIEEIIPYLIMADIDKKDIRQSLEFLIRSEIFFLHVIMAAIKSVVEPAIGVEYSTVVTTLARNGVEFGIRVSSLGEKWFTGPSSLIQGLYFPGYGPKDAGLDIGDSSITEVVGLGGFSLAASPTMALLKGGTVESALEQTKQMAKITVAKNPFFTIPFLNFEGAPMGIDIRKVVESGLTPFIDTAIAHTNGGLIGTGITRAPIECFEKALNEFKQKYNNT